MHVWLVIKTQAGSAAAFKKKAAARPRSVLQ
jgi:hypothetical protein